MAEQVPYRFDPADPRSDQLLAILAGMFGDLKGVEPVERKGYAIVEFAWYPGRENPEVNFLVSNQEWDRAYVSALLAIVCMNIELRELGG